MADNSSGNKRIARNTAFLYIRMAFVMLITLYTSRVILQSLGVVDFGIYNVVAGFVSMFSFLNTSLIACIQRYYNYEQGKNGVEGFKNVYVTSFYIQLALALLVFVAIESFGIWYLENKLVIPSDRLPAAHILFQASALSLLLVIVQVPYSAAIIAREKMDYYAFVGIADILLKLIIVFALAWTTIFDKLALYGILLFIVTIIDFLLYYVYAKRKIPEIRLSLHFDFGLFKSMMKFSGWSMLGSFAQIVRNQGLNILLNLFFGPAVNAARGISYQVRTAISSFMANVPTAARPQLIESYAKGDYRRAKQIMFTISKICFMLIYIVALPVIFEMDFLLHLWLGDSVPEYTTIFSQIIVVIAIIEALNWPVSMIIYASGKIGWYNVVTSIVGLLVLPLCYVSLIIDVNPILVYIISLLISISVQVVSVFCMKKVVNIGVYDYAKNVITPSCIVVLLTVCVPLLLTIFMQDGFIKLVMVCIVSVLWTLSICYLVGMSNNEKQLVRMYVSNFTKRIRKNHE